jgi:hypothetical protein
MTAMPKNPHALGDRVDKLRQMGADAKSDFDWKERSAMTKEECEAAMEQ